MPITEIICLRRATLLKLVSSKAKPLALMANVPSNYSEVQMAVD
jgi:hypothetical protein